MLLAQPQQAKKTPGIVTKNPQNNTHHPHPPPRQAAAQQTRF